MLYRLKDALIDFLIYIGTVAVVFATTSWFVMLIAKPLVEFSYVQSVSLVVLTFIFFAIGKIDFNIEDEDY